MGFKHQALRAVNSITSFAFRRKLPTYVQGEVIWLSKPCWSSVYSRYEPHMTKAIKEKLPTGGTFWDVGANVGLLSLYASKVVGPSGYVLAFEPSPDVLNLLYRNVEDSNIKVLPYGIGNADTEQSFCAQGTSSAASFVEEVTKINSRFHPDRAIERVTVAMRKLDTILDAALAPPPALVKIDIEGFELEALKGADGLLTSVRPTLLIEIHPQQLCISGGSEDGVMQALAKRQYRWSVIDHNPNSVYTILAEPEPR
jgi:FkbM family methyltransferase